MGDMQHFCLRWNNYQSSITSAFENLRDDEDFVDVTLACDGKSLKAHRVVLSACSPYFRELLKSTPCKHPVIVLQDVIFEDLHALVEFIYHGEVNVHQRSLSSFLKTAEVLRVSGLTQQTEVRDEVLAGSEKERGRDRGDDRGLSPPHRRTPTISHRHRERRSSTGDNPDTQDPSTVPLKRIKTNVNDNINNHSSTEGQNTPINHQDDTEEPPVDFSTTQSSKNSTSIKNQDNDLPSPVDDNFVKSEPTDLAMISSAPEHLEDSNDSGDMMSETGANQQSAIDHEDSIHSGHQSYLDSKLFAVAGASFNFSMAAALAADSLAGLNNQGHVGSGVDGLAGTSQGLGGCETVGRPSKGNLQCPYCEKRLLNRDTLSRHILHMHQEPLYVSKCHICNKEYRTRNSFMVHLSRYHRKSRDSNAPEESSDVRSDLSELFSEYKKNSSN